MQEDRIRTLLDLAEKKARTTFEGVSPKPLLIICHPSGHHQVMEVEPGGPISLPSGGIDSPWSLEEALEAFILKR